MCIMQHPARTKDGKTKSKVLHSYPVIATPFLDSAKASLRARFSAPLQPAEDPDAFGGE